jgi:hypothetical protein
MVTGIAVLGLLAGSLASFFRLDEDEPAESPTADEPVSTGATSSDRYWCSVTMGSPSATRVTTAP